jgi:hypothetical protein
MIDNQKQATTLVQSNEIDLSFGATQQVNKLEIPLTSFKNHHRTDPDLYTDKTVKVLRLSELPRKAMKQLTASTDQFVRR